MPGLARISRDRRTPFGLVTSAGLIVQLTVILPALLMRDPEVAWAASFEMRAADAMGQVKG
eukprot:2880169-Pyramimonas_sp.AAC.1